MKRIKYIYAYVTFDKYENIIATGCTIKELAQAIGKSESTIKSSLSHLKSGKIKRSRYKRISLYD